MKMTRLRSHLPQRRYPIIIVLSINYHQYHHHHHHHHHQAPSSVDSVPVQLVSNACFTVKLRIEAPASSNKTYFDSQRLYGTRLLSEHVTIINFLPSVRKVPTALTRIEH